MLRANFNLTIRGGRKLFDYVNQAKKLRDNSIHVGFFSESRYPSGMPVASVAAINEFGGMGRRGRIPERPFFRPAIEEEKPNIKRMYREELREANRQAARGGMGFVTFDEELAAAVGGVLAKQIQKNIDELWEPDNTEATYAKKLGRYKRRKIDLTSIKPLHFSGKMRNSVKYKLIQHYAS